MAALLCLGIMVGFRFLLDPWLEDHYSLTPFLFGVAFSAWYGGWKPGVLFLVGSVLLANYFFVYPRNSLEVLAVGQRVGILIYLVAGIACLFLVQTLKTTHRRAREHFGALEDAMARLAAAHAKVDGIVQAIPDVLYMFNTEGKFQWWNANLERVTGCTSEQMQRNTPIDFFDPKDHPQVLAAIQQTFAGHLERVKLPLKTPGGLVPYEFNSITLKDSNGIPLGIVGVGRDISEHLALNQSLQQAKEEADANLRRNRLIIDSAYDAFIAVNVAGRILDWNPRAETQFGWPRAEALGRLLPETIIAPACRDNFQQVLDQVLQTESKSGLNQRMELLALHRDGREIPMEVCLATIHSPAGNVIHAFLHDITERKKAAEASAAARAAAEAANQAKSDFLASMSHEIRTPMNGIMGMLGLLLDTPLDERQRDMAEIARNSADSLLTILNDILDFSKIEAGKLVIEKISFDLRHTIEEVASMMALQAAQKELDLLVHYPPGAPCQVIGDAGRVRQILINLLGNAVKFTEKGHVLLTLEVLPSAGEIPLFRFSVQDTGIGIPPDKQLGIFGRFIQADATTTRRYGGTGLGLAISKQLAELMGGSIQVVSQVGVGSTFSFTLPLDPEGTSPPEEKSNLAGVRVLIVDDNEVNRKILHEQIVAWGMRNGSCVFGPEALRRLRSEADAGDPYQMVLIDYHMPDMDGVQLAREIKSDPQLRDLELIMLSSVGAAPGLSGNPDFAASLVKPVRQSQLHDALASAWGSHLRKKSGFHTLANSSSHSSTDGNWKARVLVVDDNAVNQKVAKMMLEQLGCRVDVAGNGKEAVEMVRMLPFDLVFMDCEMPVLDGYQATQEIRRSEGLHPHLPIVAMTARALQGDRQGCLSAGMDDYLSKPVKKECLVEILDRWVPGCRNLSSLGSENGAITLEEAPVFDPDELAQLKALAADSAPNLFSEIVTSFLNDSRQGLKDLRQALAEGPEALRQKAHWLKGMCASMGAKRLRELSQELEIQGDEGNLEGVENLIGRWELEFRNAENELHDALMAEGTLETAAG